MRKEEKQIPYKEKVSNEKEIETIIKSVFGGLYENGYVGNSERKIVKKVKIMKVPANPNTKKDGAQEGYPHYPIYIVCPSRFEHLYYEHKDERTIIDYEESLNNHSQYRYDGKSIAFEPRRKESMGIRSTNSFDGDYLEFSAPVYTESDGTGGSGKGYVALSNPDGQLKQSYKSDIKLKYAVLFVGMVGFMKHKGTNSQGYHAVAVMKK